MGFEVLLASPVQYNFFLTPDTYLSRRLCMQLIATKDQPIVSVPTTHLTHLPVLTSYPIKQLVREAFSGNTMNWKD